MEFTITVKNVLKFRPISKNPLAEIVMFFDDLCMKNNRAIVDRLSKVRKSLQYACTDNFVDFIEIEWFMLSLVLKY